MGMGSHRQWKAVVSKALSTSPTYISKPSISSPGRSKLKSSKSCRHDFSTDMSHTENTQKWSSFLLATRLSTSFPPKHNKRLPVPRRLGVTSGLLVRRKPRSLQSVCEDQPGAMRDANKTTSSLGRKSKSSNFPKTNRFPTVHPH